MLREILTTCLLVISQTLLASAQQDKRHASLIRAETREAEHRLNEFKTGLVQLFEFGFKLRDLHALQVISRSSGEIV